MAAGDIAAVRETVLQLVQGYVQGAVDPAEPLGAQGLDSLALMELRQKLQVRTDTLPAHLCDGQ